MKHIWVIAKRELGSYFTSPVAYVFLVIFLLLTGFFTFTAGQFFERGEANLGAFFAWHPWLYLVLVPAVGMRLWAEERRAGTLELLMTMPITPWQAIVGKFLASWIFLAVALALTFPVAVTGNVLGSPANGTIFAGYLGSLPRHRQERPVVLEVLGLGEGGERVGVGAQALDAAQVRGAVAHPGQEVVARLERQGDGDLLDPRRGGADSASVQDQGPGYPVLEPVDPHSAQPCHRRSLHPNPYHGVGGGL